MKPHRIREYRKFTPGNLALLDKENFVRGNKTVIDTLRLWKDDVVSSGWLTDKEIADYESAFYKAENSNNDTEYRKYRKLTEHTLVKWDNLYYDSLDFSEQNREGCIEVSAALYHDMQEVRYLTDEQWRERYAGITAKTKSVFMQRYTATGSHIAFPNPYRKEMENAWRIPEGYSREEIKEAFMPLSVFVPQAMTLYKQGDSLSALGICFDLLDMLCVLKKSDSLFFSGDDEKESEIPLSGVLVDVTLYVISKIYKDKRTSAKAKDEILMRLDGYHTYENFPSANYISGNFHPFKLIEHYGGFVMENLCRPFFGLPAFKANEAETDEYPAKWKNLRTTLIGKALEIRNDCMDLSDEELILLSKLYATLFFFTDKKGERIRESESYQERLDEIGDELDCRCRIAGSLDKQAMLLDAVSNFSRIWPYFDTALYKNLMQGLVRKVEVTPDVDYRTLHVVLRLLQLEPLTTCVNDDDACGSRRYEFSVGEDLFKSTLRSWAETQNDDGSWMGISADEAYGRIVIAGMDFGSMYEVDNYRLTILAYNHYCTTPCDTPEELYSKYQAYCHKRGITSGKMSVPIMYRTMEMLKSPKLTLVEKLYLYNIVL